MKPTEFTVRALREATDTPPTVAFDCAVWLANQRTRSPFTEDCERRIVEYLTEREKGS